jgi:hypothetical protein
MHFEVTAGANSKLDKKFEARSIGGGHRNLQLQCVQANESYMLTPHLFPR